MKKTITLVLLLLAVVLLGSNLTKISAAEGTTLKPEVLYFSDFENYEVGATGNDVYDAEKLMWFETMVGAKIVDVEGDKQLRYTIEDIDGGFTRFGGIGTGEIGNLAKLVGGQKYHFSMYVDTTNAAAGSTLWIEYQSDVWVGAKITNGVAEPCDGNNVFNLSYVNNVLEFDFFGYNFGTNMDKGWVKLTAQNMEVYDTVLLDDLSITAVVETGAAFSQDYEGMTVGATATPAGTNIANIWDADAASVTINEENGNKYLSINNTTDSQAWPKFYFNQLPFVSGEEYLVEFDIISHNFAEFYICYPESGTAELTYTYGPEGFLYGGGNGALGATTFDGTHLTVVVTPNESFGQYWAQLAIVTKHSGELDLKIDNVKITKTSLMENAAKSISTNVSEVTLCVGKELSVEGLEVTLTRNNDASRVLAANEYVVDASAVNKDAAGEYPVIVKVVDEFGNTVTSTITVKYVAHTEVVDAAVAPTCTEKGKTEGKHCSECNEVLVAQEEVAAKGHSYDDGVVTKEPTTEEAGIKTFTCTCGDSYTEEIAKLEPQPSTSGCGGSVIASVLGVVALAGATLFIAKRKREE